MDNLTDDQIRTLEAQKFMKKFRPNGLHPDRVSVDQMSDDQIRSLEAQRNRYEYDAGVHPDRITVDQMSDDQIRSLEAQRNRYEYDAGVHPDRVTVDQMSDEQIRSLEAQRNRYDIGPSGIHPDRVGIENMDDDQIRSIEADVRARKERDVPFKKYFKDLVETPVILDEKEFNEAVVYSMQSNTVIQDFLGNLTDKIGEKVYSFRTIDSDNKKEVEERKNEIEQLVYVYERFLYKLKEERWNFKTIGFDVASMKLPEGVYDRLWKLQKEYGISFSLQIPADLGEDYGAAFERTGKMIPGLNLMYDELNNKEVNWHQVINYREGELTPYQRFSQRRR